MLKLLSSLATCAGITFVTSIAFAQAPATPPVNPAAQMLPIEYGAIISNANAKKAAAAALAEAQKMNVPMVVAITDTSGNVLYLERMDSAILGGVLVAPQKARSAALYKRPTKAFEDAITPGGVGLRFLRLEGQFRSKVDCP